MQRGLGFVATNEQPHLRLVQLPGHSLQLHAQLASRLLRAAAAQRPGGKTMGQSGSSRHGATAAAPWWRMQQLPTHLHLHPCAPVSNASQPASQHPPHPAHPAHLGFLGRRTAAQAQRVRRRLPCTARTGYTSRIQPRRLARCSGLQLCHPLLQGIVCGLVVQRDGVGAGSGKSLMGWVTAEDEVQCTVQRGSIATNLLFRGLCTWEGVWRPEGAPSHRPCIKRRM